MRKTTDKYLELDVRRLYRKGLLRQNHSFSWHWSRNDKPIGSIRVYVKTDCVILEYRTQTGDEEWKSYNYPINLVKTPCNYGGERFWFICPSVSCGRRVAILYGGDIFACRHCHQLAYRSQREHFIRRAVMRANKIRDRLGWKPGIFEGYERPPKGMHWHTFQRLQWQHIHCAEIVVEQMQMRLNKFKNAR